MKKFYISIFASALLLAGFSLQAQVYNSITTNPTPFTYDDPRFWNGAVPPNPCTGCDINIFAPVTMVQSGNSSALPPTTKVFTTQTPLPTAAHDAPGALTVGMRFLSTVAGQVTGVSFYKNSIMAGPHTGALYTNTGTQLASVAFTGETVSGWQVQNFAAPVTIQPGVTYVIAVYMADGNYLFSSTFNDPGNDFTLGITNGNMVALQDAGSVHNGVYDYGAALAFPTSFFTPGANYWVDVAFAATPVNLNNMVFNNSSLRVNGNGTVLNVNTYVQLTNSSKLLIATDPTYGVVVDLNDQVDLASGSTVQIGNGSSYINSNNIAGNTIIGPHDDFTDPGNKVAGIYSIFTGPPVGGVNYSYVLTPSAIGFNQTAPPPPTIQQASYAYLPLNCGGAGGCAPGFVSGPASTGNDPAGNLGIIFNSSAVLPVQLVQLLASRNDDGSIKISWATSQEQNASYYDVERSSDQAGWAKIGSVKAKGYSSTTTNYSYNDQLPLDGTGYYRLKMTDLDGKFTYSKAVSVSDNKNKIPLVVYSNPFNDQIRLKVNVSRAQNLVLTVSDMMGKTYLTQSYHAQSGDNFVNLLPPATASGMYILRIHGDSYNQTVKLEKQ